MGGRICEPAHIFRHVRRIVSDNVRVGLPHVGGRAAKRMANIGDRATVEFRLLSVPHHGLDPACRGRAHLHAAGMVYEPQHQFHARNRSREHFPVLDVQGHRVDVQLGQLRRARTYGRSRAVRQLQNEATVVENSDHGHRL